MGPAQRDSEHGRHRPSSVIVWFESAEQMLMAVLDVIPYEAVHENVWSPRLVTVLLETCSQLDSLLKQQAVQSPCVASQNLNITDYFALFGQDLSGKWVLFWGESPRVRPFGAWQGLAGYGEASYPGHELKWWKAYNKIKHNRIENRREATLRHRIEALGGLFLAILYCEICRDAVGASGWLQSHSPNPKANLDNHLNPMPGSAHRGGIEAVLLPGRLDEAAHKIALAVVGHR